MIESTHYVQIVVSQLRPSATRAQFVELHRQTADWMARHPGCVSYEVFEGVDGQVADRIVWVDQPAALRANREFAATAIAAGMQDIIASYQNFFGAPVLLR